MQLGDLWNGRTQAFFLYDLKYLMIIFWKGKKCTKTLSYVLKIFLKNFNYFQLPKVNGQGI